MTRVRDGCLFFYYKTLSAMWAMIAVLLVSAALQSVKWYLHYRIGLEVGVFSRRVDIAMV